LPIYRGDGLIKGFTVQEIVSVLRSPNARQECEGFCFIITLFFT
jgi:hypothetical protein